jgi:transcription antitermination factor NusG
LEEDIVFFLLQMALPAHELQCAFMRDSIRGWVYLETRMNRKLCQLLKCTPGIIVRDSGLISQRIEFKDWLPLLKMHDDARNMPQVGKWAEVKKGLYKGDVGCVDSVETWGVQLLLIPRLPPPEPSYALPAKRKHTRPRPMPQLFDPVAIKQVYDVDPNHIRENFYSFKGYNFDQGLIIKTYDFKSISTIVPRMPFSSVSLFRESHHPKVIASQGTIPRPSEWEFTEGDEVDIHSWSFRGVVAKHGVITRLLSDSVDVDHSNDEGIVRFSWLDIRKALRPGDYVEITGGVYRGRSGWFYEISNHLRREEEASVLELKDIEHHLPNRVEVCPCC